MSRAEPSRAPVVCPPHPKKNIPPHLPAAPRGSNPWRRRAAAPSCRTACPPPPRSCTAPGGPPSCGVAPPFCRSAALPAPAPPWPRPPAPTAPTGAGAGQGSSWHRRPRPPPVGAGPGNGPLPFFSPRPPTPSPAPPGPGRDAATPGCAVGSGPGPPPTPGSGASLRGYRWDPPRTPSEPPPCRCSALPDSPRQKNIKKGAPHKGWWARGGHILHQAGAGHHEPWCASSEGWASPQSGGAPSTTDSPLHP